MKNKKFTYLLIGLVAVIWGFFFYTLFSNNSPQTNQQNSSFEPLEAGQDSIVFKALNLSYKDPFLARKIVSKRYSSYNDVTALKRNTLQKKTKPVVKTPSKVFTWPEVEYGGTLNGSKGLLTFKKKRIIASEGQQIDEYKIVNIYPDSIRIAYKEKTKVFFKNR